MSNEIKYIIPLSYNLADKKRKYVLFCGAGISKDAGIPTGWDILLDTLRHIRYQMEGETKEYTNEEMENFYKEKFKDITYSEIIDRLFPANEEQREFLEELFENKHPGKAHNLIAEWVASDLVRFIVTTNFDSKIEEALDNLDMRGKYSVISNGEQVLTSKPWHLVETCRIYKPHGTLEQGKLRNTEKDLEVLDDDIGSAILDIIENHGVIVLGYAGEDKGIMDLLNKRKFKGYTLYWTTHSGKHNIDVEKLLENQDGILVKIQSASDFLEEVLNRVEIAKSGIEQTSEIVAQTKFKNIITSGVPDAEVRITINEERTKLINFIKTILAEVDEGDYNSLWEGYKKIFNYSHQFLLLTEQVIKYQDKYWNDILPLFEEIHSLNQYQGREGKEGLVNYSFYTLFEIISAITIHNEKFELLRLLLNFKRMNRDRDKMEPILSWNTYATFITIKNDNEPEYKWLFPRMHYLRGLIETQSIPFEFNLRERILEVDTLCYLHTVIHPLDSIDPYWFPASLVYEGHSDTIYRIKLDEEFGGKVASELFGLDYPKLIEHLVKADQAFQKEISRELAGHRLGNPFSIFR